MNISSDKKILYIAGSSRCGSTIIGNILGSIPGFVHTGEVRFIWDRGLYENWICSCGEPFLECVYWRKILSKAYGESFEYQKKLMQNINKLNVARLRKILTSPAATTASKIFSQQAGIINILDKLYNAIGNVSKSSVIIDGSAHPHYGILLNNFKSIKLYVLHVVRDVRAVANSQLNNKHKQPTQKGEFQRMGQGMTLTKVCKDWMVRNLQIEYLLRNKSTESMFLRYEDFCQNPRGTINNILCWIKEKPDSLPFVSSNECMIKGNHVFSGNPVRFNNGHISIKCDQKWKAKLSIGRQITAAALGLPFFLKYRYYSY